MFPLPKGKPEFSKLEEAILAKWKAEKTFEKSVESRPAENPYRFYDGPPFITGNPHYGTLLSSIIKDAIPRYQTMLGKRVERIWGWDCHGMPIEQKVQAKLGLESNKAIEESEGGIQRFIDECYNYTSSTSVEWNWYIDHIGRWVDMEHAYRTMDQDYMESVMWVFKQIWEKGYVYEGKRVSWYSWKLSTPISNFEIAMDDSYQDVQDPAVTIKFPIDNVKKGAGIIIQDEEGKLLMIKNKKDGLWRFPGGNAEPGETYHTCAARELLEETEITCELKPYCSTYIGYRGLFYEALSFRGVVPVGHKVILEEDKFSDYEYFSLDALPLHSEIHRMEHDLIDFLTGVREPVIVSEIPEVRKVNILAWTTTPWTLPMHMALAVNRDLQYVSVYHAEEIYIVAASRVETVFKGKGDYQVLGTIPGEELIGLSYKPPFDYYLNKTPFLKGDGDTAGTEGDLSDNKSSASSVGTSFKKEVGDKNFKIYHADFVTDTDGTGIAHEAPEFGDVDFQLAKQEGIHITSAIDEAGKYTAEVPEYQGQLYIDAIDPICERLKSEGTLFKKESITHRVPYCPRSNTPLMQRAQKSWFIDIQRIKGELIEQNENINWFPDHFKHGRFLKSLESAPDWCISRTRFWGTPMPIWQNKDGSERVVIGSREELYQANKPLGQITKIICARHGESEANVAEVYEDVGVSPLTEKGKKQAEALAEKLSSEGVEVILSSPFVRAVQTVEPIAKKLGITIQALEALRELNHGNFANQKNDEDSRESRNAFRADPEVKFGETGESKNDVRNRVREVIEIIRRDYIGKTVLVMSHGFPIEEFMYELGHEKMPEKFTNATPWTVYMGPNGKEINLHRPTIDGVYIPSTLKAPIKPKKVLGIHGWTSMGISRGYDGKWLPLQDLLKEKGIQFDVPNFDQNKETTYAKWRETLEGLDMSSYDTILATSFGCPVIMQYLCEKNIHGKRLVLVAPSGLKGNEYLEKVIPEMTEDVEKLRGLVDEIIITHSEDDDSKSAPFSYGKSLASKIGATFLPINGVGHAFGGWSIDFLSSLVQFGIPLSRIPEVLDVWMDSASMPYAQVHYPFENVEKMEASFPADFIAEYTGQIRAWFYVMHVLGVLVKGSPAFKNVAVTGVINGTDGRKMSKSYGNYPDPKATIEQYGADALRFYLMGGPIMRGEDMNFSETGIAESLKKVLLPLWNSYTFFATYANIDGWKPDGTEVWFTRHGKSEANEVGVMSGAENDTELSEKGREQVRVLQQHVAQQKAFDTIICSPRKRTVDTISGLGDYILDADFLEQQSGEFDGMKLVEIGEQIGTHDVSRIRDAYRWNKVEPWDVFYAKISGAIERVIAENKGKKILFCAHAGVFRAFTQYFADLHNRDIFYGSGIKNACLYRFPKTPKTHELDTWIISQLHNLIADTRKHMDNYDTQKACDGFVTFLDGLNNWYIRRNRRRFWRKEVDADKCSAYETLHEVLTTVCQLLAPICPFITEYLYQNLTGSHSDSNSHRKDLNEMTLSGMVSENSKTNSTLGLGLVSGTGPSSVHLTYFPEANPLLLNLTVNQKMRDLQNLTNLGLAIRGREKLRVRQPLRSASITLDLDESARATLAEELNVKEIHTISDIAEYVTITYSPDAKQIGATERKQWMKTIIADAKAGKGVLTPDGNLEITLPEAPDGKIVLAADEFETVYTPREGSTIAFVGNAGYVIGLDTTLDEALTFEGYARDLIRAIQDARKEMGFQVTDRLQLSLTSENPILMSVLEAHGTLIEAETLCTLTGALKHGSTEPPKSIELDEDFSVEIKIEK